MTILPDGTQMTELASGAGLSGIVQSAITPDGSIIAYAERFGQLKMISPDGTLIRGVPVGMGSMSFFTLFFDIDATGSKAVFSAEGEFPQNLPFLDLGAGGYIELVFADWNIGNVEAGKNVLVPIDDDIWLIFDDVPAPFEVDVAIAASTRPGESLALNFGDPPLVFDVTPNDRTIFPYNGETITFPFTICMEYGEHIGSEWARVYVRGDFGYQEVTSMISGKNQIVCGRLEEPIPGHVDHGFTVAESPDRPDVPEIPKDQKTTGLDVLLPGLSGCVTTPGESSHLALLLLPLLLAGLYRYLTTVKLFS